MNTFSKQDWQAVFLKAAQEMQLKVSGVTLISTVDQDFIDCSGVVSHVISNSETEHSVLGADFYLARPLLNKMLPADTQGKQLVITQPSIRESVISDTVFNVSMRYAFIKGSFNLVVEPVGESEADRIKREEDEELEQMQREEDARAFEASEKERIANEQRILDEQAAEAQRVKDEEAAVEAERLALLNKGDDDFPEEELNK